MKEGFQAMRPPLRVVLSLALVALFPWLATSVAANLQVILETPPALIGIQCGNHCLQYQGVPVLSGGSTPDFVGFYFALMVALLVGASYLAWRRGIRGTRKDSFWYLPSLVLYTAFVYVLVIVAESLNGQPSFATGGGGLLLGPWTTYLLLALVGAAGVASVAWTLTRPGNAPVSSHPRSFADSGGEASAVLHRAIYSLQVGGDPRSVIIDCYRRLVGVIQKGRESLGSPDMTAREFEVASEQVLSVDHESLHRLTTLFEKARYSDAEVDPREASEAEAVLSDLKSQIDGGAHQA